MAISVFGLGKLGATMLSCYAHKKWHVIGVDINEENVRKINENCSPIEEAYVQQYLHENKEYIEATTDVAYAINNTDISFIIVPTPSEEDGSFSISCVKKVIEDIGAVLKFKSTYHLVVVTSTVLPGDMGYLQGVLEDVSDKKCSPETFGLCYNPEFIALGRIVHDSLNPDIVLIGQSDERAGLALEIFQRAFVENIPEYHRMSFCNAELTKVGINSYLTMKINFANNIGEICEKMINGDAGKVLNAIGSDSRIGNKYFKAGLPAMGPCLPRDCRALINSAWHYEVDFPLASASEYYNEYQKNRIIQNILDIMGAKDNDITIAILGLSYKENTPVIEESLAINIAETYARKNNKIKIYDPMALDNAMYALRRYSQVIRSDSVQDCLEGSQLCIIATPWSEFKHLYPKDFIDSMECPVVYDMWGILPFNNGEGVVVHRIGQS